jgi:hypothetical protein
MFCRPMTARNVTLAPSGLCRGEIKLLDACTEARINGIEKGRGDLIVGQEYRYRMDGSHLQSVVGVHQGVARL